MARSEYKTRTAYIKIRILLCTLLCVLVLSPATVHSAVVRPRVIVLPSILEISNVRDVTFNISWTSPAAETCKVVYGSDPGSLSAVCYDDRGRDVKVYTHYVTIGDGGDGEASLRENTVYYFYVISGKRSYGTKTTLFKCMTGPTLSIPNSRMIYGEVLMADRKTRADGALVYMTVRDKDAKGSKGDSAVLSSLVSSGYWYLNLDGIRTRDLKEYFIYSADGDYLIITAEDGRQGSASLKVRAGMAPPLTPMVIRRGTNR